MAHVWLADPERQEFYIYDGGGLRPTATLELPDCGVSIEPEDVF
ncbi:MAG: hypothetical protein R2724_24270 [Bryobacterales bacterium]